MHGGEHLHIAEVSWCICFTLYFLDQRVAKGILKVNA